MANDVYANGREISCKAGSGKTIGAFPDVCFTPPENPATPPGVPIPYPNTGMTSDTTSGSKTVKISDKEVMLKNKSYFKKSMGDEAGCAAKKGVLTSVHRGKVYFTAWSMDVKVEGENVVRHLDLTTHNHASTPGNSPPWMFTDSSAIGTSKDKCQNERKAVDEDCGRAEFYQGSPQCSQKCCDAKKCVLSPYDSAVSVPGTRMKRKIQCCDGKTKHHIIPDHCFKAPGETGDYYEGIRDMSYEKGLAVCATGEDKETGTPYDQCQDHAKIHRDFDRIENEYRDGNDGRWDFAEANEVAADVVGFHVGCNPECLKQQTEQFYKNKNAAPGTQLRADADSGSRPDPATVGNMSRGTVRVWRS